MLVLCTMVERMRHSLLRINLLPSPRSATTSRGDTIETRISRSANIDTYGIFPPRYKYTPVHATGGGSVREIPVRKNVSPDLRPLGKKD